MTQMEQDDSINIVIRIVLARETMMEALICDVSLANAKIIDKLLFEDILKHVTSFLFIG